MKLIFNAFVIFVLTLFIWMVLFNRNPLKNVETYKVYYGKAFDNIEISFEDYDLMIIEPSHYSKEDILYYRENTSSLYFGYLSVFEIPNWYLEYSNKISSEDYLKVDNEFVYNRDYKNYIGDIRSDVYRNILLDEVEKSIINKGFDGIFLDTVDWIDYFLEDKPLLSDDLLAGYLIFLDSLKEAFPDLIVVQNRSFRAFEKGAHKLVDGFMWENYSRDKALNEDIKKTALLYKNQFLYHQQIFVLSHDGQQSDEKFAKFSHWKYYNNTLSSYGIWE